MQAAVVADWSAAPVRDFDEAFQAAECEQA
jgi:hypothetical protein